MSQENLILAKNVSGYDLFNISIFVNIISDIEKCKNCASDLTTLHEVTFTHEILNTLQKAAGGIK